MRAGDPIACPNPILQAHGLPPVVNRREQCARFAYLFTKGNAWRTLKSRSTLCPISIGSQCEAVESIPGKVSGAWVFRGTRMPVKTVFENLEAGATTDELLEWFDGLEREQVIAVLHFVAQSLEKEPTYAPELQMQR
jgi:uncharacterized protein (DUF433 family)